ncbi:amidase [Roseomonas gilardii]|uniref:Amidase n=1 Tax=Roseomonas gilardii TaxID=257708 RepID=A0ABU3MGT6_9PROT|nr:amidase [Roseomonas gilardii]MDT8331967.1 amidase [Roseomonas gilardii]
MPQPRLRPYLSRIQGFAAGRDSPRAVLEECLEALEGWEPRIGAFTALGVEAARRAADGATLRWRDGRALSPIDGMPVGIKDTIETEDLPTGMGSPLYDGYQPRFDAASVQGLREAGAVILGKTVTTEFASTEPRGTRNPWDTERTPGGSSSGSAAAVAAGEVCGALGTQVVGSILRPSGFCGAYGFKPGVGGLNRGGSLDFLSQSCTGPIAASLEDCWAMAIAIAERVGGDPGYPGLGGPKAPPPARRPERLALLRTAGWTVLEPQAQAALEAALESLRRAGVEILDAATCPELAAVEDAVAPAMEIVTRINAWEWLWPLGSYMRRDPAGLSQATHRRWEMARSMTRADYAMMLDRRQAARETFACLAARCDAVVSLTAPGAAPVGLGSTGNPVFVAPGSMLGVPALALPCLTAGGLPLGLQLLGFRDADATLFGHAAWVDRALSAA